MKFDKIVDFSLWGSLKVLNLLSSRLDFERLEGFPMAAGYLQVVSRDYLMIQ
jgi:hypothetical protein